MAVESVMLSLKASSREDGSRRGMVSTELAWNGRHHIAALAESWRPAIEL